MSYEFKIENWDAQVIWFHDDMIPPMYIDLKTFNLVMFWLHNLIIREQKIYLEPWYYREYFKTSEGLWRSWKFSG